MFLNSREYYSPLFLTFPRGGTTAVELLVLSGVYLACAYTKIHSLTFQPNSWKDEKTDTKLPGLLRTKSQQLLNTNGRSSQQRVSSPVEWHFHQHEHQRGAGTYCGWEGATPHAHKIFRNTEIMLFS